MIRVVDAFADAPFRGNPAGVCILDQPAAERWMQDVAAELNLAETAFLYPQGDGYHLRWFTPVVEVALCGHATLASAHVLWEAELLPADRQARFHTLSGLLTADREADWIRLDFPAKPPAAAEPPAGLLDALGIANPRWVGRNEFDCIVEVESGDVVRALAPDFSRLARVETRGAMVTARASGTDYDFVSRFFAPAVGVAEDPVTGSAHCCLAPYWSERLGKQAMTGYQASVRGGVVKVVMQGDRVWLYGQAVTVLNAELVAAGRAD